MTDSSEYCHTCQFGQAIEGSMEHYPLKLPMYSCRRYPPTKSIGPYASWQWPEMHPRDWCGEWRAAE